MQIFIELRLAEGMPLDEAVIDAGAVRFRPMMLQGLAIAPMAGEIASLLLSRMAVPVLFWFTRRSNRKRFPSLGLNHPAIEPPAHILADGGS